MKKLFLLLLMIPVSLLAQISCGSGFANGTSGACTVAQPGGELMSLGQNWTSGSNSFPPGYGDVQSGSVLRMMANGCGHCVENLWDIHKQNIQAFTTTFVFVPNNSGGFGFGIQNNTQYYAGTGYNTTGGASGENFIQNCCYGSPNNIIFNKYDPFYGSTTEIGAANPYTCQSGIGNNCNSPASFGLNIGIIQPSLSPVSLTANSPYTATITYDGQTWTQTITDSVGNTSTQVWKVNVPALVGGNTAYVGFAQSTGSASTGYDGTLIGWTYTPITPTASSPNLSVTGGSYAGTQTVGLHSNSVGSIQCYTTNSTTPATNGGTGCSSGTLYTVPVTIASTQTLKSVAGGTGFADSPASSQTYTIGSTTAATPTFSPAAGTYSGTQSVTIPTSSSGAIKCYTVNGTTPATNGTTGCTTGTLYSGAVSVAASETVKAIAGGTGFTDSAVASAAYVITAPTTTTFTINGTATITGTFTITTH